MRKYEVETKKFSEIRDKIEIPKFQRGLVWNKSKKEEFIRSLKEGLPIGVLLLFKKNGKYMIIDGLQRFTTMLDYSKDFFGYIQKEEITDIDLNSIVISSPDARKIFDGYTASAKDAEFSKMRDILVKEISNGKGKNIFAISKDASNTLCKEIAALPDKDFTQIQGEVYSIVDKIFTQSKIDDITIPLIIFTGDESELANIFQKLNQEGVKLSKYDVFAASWINHSVTVKNDPAFIEHIINKYEKAQEASELEIDSYDSDEMKQNGQLTVFEYAFALGKALMEKCKKLFSKADDAKVDGIGFLILAELMGLTYQDMGKLADTIDTYKSLDFKKLKDAILDSASLVESYLGSYIDSPIRKNGKRASLACHSELQLASYIIVVFRLKYMLSVQNGLEQKSKSKDLGKIKEHLYKHYLYDILRGYWAGSGNTKLEEIIADPTTCRYTRDVDRDEFEMVVGTWLESANKKGKLTNVSAETKLFLNYLLRTSGVYDDKIDYDVEHCVPRDVVKKYYNNKVPMSAPCNLVYIPSKDNHSKGEKTYYQRQASDPGTYQLDEAQLDAYGYPSKQELSFTDSTSKLTQKNYYDYLDGRKKVILKKFISDLYD